MKYLAALSLIGGISLAYSQPVLGSPSPSNIEQRVQEIDSELAKLDQEKRLLQNKDAFEHYLSNAEKYLQTFVSDDLLTVEEQEFICSELRHSIGLANQNQGYLEVPEIWKTRYQQMKDNYEIKIFPFGIKESGLEQELRNSGYKDVIVEYNESKWIAVTEEVFGLCLVSLILSFFNPNTKKPGVD